MCPRCFLDGDPQGGDDCSWANFCHFRPFTFAGHLQIFQLFLRYRSLTPVVSELNRRGWTLKRWKAKEGKWFGGARFDVNSLRRLLTNHAYIGKVCFNDAIYDAEHQAIIDQETWDRVQKLITRRTRDPKRRILKSNALLAGILRCSPCDAAMSPTFTQKGRLRYRYYLCTKAHRHGWDSCPSKSVPALEIEKFVIDQIRAIGRNQELIAGVVQKTSAKLAARKSSLESELRHLRKTIERAHTALRKRLHAVSANARQDRHTNSQDPAEEIPKLEDRLRGVREELDVLKEIKIDPEELSELLRRFDPIWERMSSSFRARVVRTLIERIDYDGGSGKLGIELRPMGVRLLKTEAPEVIHA